VRFNKRIVASFFVRGYIDHATPLVTVTFDGFAFFGFHVQCADPFRNIDPAFRSRHVETMLLFALTSPFFALGLVTR